MRVNLLDVIEETQKHIYIPVLFVTPCYLSYTATCIPWLSFLVVVVLKFVFLLRV